MASSFEAAAGARRLLFLSLIATAAWLPGVGRAQQTPAPTTRPATRPALAPLRPSPFPTFRSDPSLPTLFIVGDSTVKNGTRGQLGWGDPIARFFDRSRINVENHAIGGRSSRTFINEGRWDRILTAAKAGDFVLVQMGHNDGGPLDDPARARGSLRGTGEETREIDNPLTGKHEVVHTYGWYLRKYVADARGKGMTPILCSPIPHCPQRPVELGSVEASNYVKWSAEVAKDQNVLFVDLNRITMHHYAALEPAQIKERYFTSADNTHTNGAGAEVNAASVVLGLRALKDCPLAGYLLDKPQPTTAPAGRGRPETAPAVRP